MKPHAGEEGKRWGLSLARPPRLFGIDDFVERKTKKSKYNPQSVGGTIVYTRLSPGT